MSVVYIDTRPDWMKREDEYMKCFWECELLDIASLNSARTAKCLAAKKYQKSENDSEAKG